MPIKTGTNTITLGGMEQAIRSRMVQKTRKHIKDMLGEKAETVIKTA